ncbi:MAG: oxidoreductase [Bacteroidetes bacterium]|nr:oxidoreductase [Bacteroidota bacterium]
MKKRLSFYLVLQISLFSCLQAGAQKKYPEVEILTSGTNTSLRGLSVVNDNVIWVSGSNGTVGRSNNGGKTWKWMTVTGFEKNDFRDIEAFDASTAIIMSISEPAYILKTTDGGSSWKVVYENKNKGMFLDAMEFWNDQMGIVVGDPIDGRFFIAKTSDNGSTWHEEIFNKRPLADSGEGCFASSGTNIRSLNPQEAVFISGGLRSRMYIPSRNKVIDLPFLKGKETAGANSISVFDYFKKNGGRRIVVMGGDFNNDSSVTANCFLSYDGGQTWKQPDVAPHGYRSCVEYLTKKEIIACGLNGVDYTVDNGRNWKWISKESFHVCRISKFGSAVYLAGRNGKIAKLLWEP